jgi:hypothetical protein
MQIVNSFQARGYAKDFRALRNVFWSMHEVSGKSVAVQIILKVHPRLLYDNNFFPV